MSCNLVNLGSLKTGATYLDRIPHELSVYSLVSTKSNCGRAETKNEYMRNTERAEQGDYLVVGNLFTFPPRAVVSTHSWEI